jgi:uncharacterized membrane protein YciS (DUF1049 family)
MPDWKKIKGEVRLHLSSVMIVIGLAVLMFVGVQYLRMHLEQRRLVAAWERQQQTAGQTALVDDGLTRLSIPRST